MSKKASGGQTATSRVSKTTRGKGKPAPKPAKKRAVALARGTAKRGAKKRKAKRSTRAERASKPRTKARGRASKAAAQPKGRRTKQVRSAAGRARATAVAKRERLAARKALAKQRVAAKKAKLAARKAAAQERVATKKAKLLARKALAKARASAKQQKLVAKRAAAKERKAGRERRLAAKRAAAFERAAGRERKRESKRQAVAARAAAKLARTEERAIQREAKRNARASRQLELVEERRLRKEQRRTEKRAAAEQRAETRRTARDERALEKRRRADERRAAVTRRSEQRKLEAAERSEARRAARKSTKPGTTSSLLSPDEGPRRGLVVVRRRTVDAAQPNRDRKASATPFLPQADRMPLEVDTGLALRNAEQQLGLTLTQPQRRIAKTILAGRDVLVTGRSDESMRNSWLVAAVAAPKTVLMSSGSLEELRACHEFLSLHGVRSLLLVNSGTQPSLPPEDCQVVLGLPNALVELSRAAASAGVPIRASRILVLQAQRVSAESPDYSPAYERLRELLETMNAPPIAVSMQPSVAAAREETLSVLGLRNPSQFLHGTSWSNLELEIVPARGEVKQRFVERVLRQIERPAVMFCATPEDVDEVFETLQGSDEEVYRYHQEMAPGQRASEQLQFLLSDEALMIATSAFDKITLDEARAEKSVSVGTDDVPVAFGAGIRKTNIRSVIHYQAPLSIEQYAQEIELAGADGEPAKCVMFFDPADPELSEARLDDARIEAFQLTTFGNNVAALASTQETFNWEELVLASSLEPRVLRRFMQLAIEIGTICRDGDQFRLTVSAMALPTAMRGLGKKLTRHQLSDRERLAAISSFARQRSCIVKTLRSSFGMGPKTDCGVCGHCNPRAWLALSAGETTSPANAALDGSRRQVTPTTRGVSEHGSITSYLSGRRGPPGGEVSQ